MRAQTCHRDSVIALSKLVTSARVSMPPRKAAIGSRTPPRSLLSFERLRGAFARLGPGRASQPLTSTAVSDIGEPFQELNAGIADAGGDELTARITDEEFIQFRDKCKRFRVLVIGPRHAGKTTILERLTGDSIEKAQIRSQDGKIVRPIYAFSDEKGKRPDITCSLRSMSDFKEARV